MNTYKLKMKTDKLVHKINLINNNLLWDDY